MKATVRFDDVFEGEDLPDIYRQVLDYLQNVVDQEDLEAFDITLEKHPKNTFRPEEWKSAVLNE